MSFYRIYRPQIIEEIDNTAVREQLLSLLTKDKKDLPHAYLFIGSKGAGKTTAARLIAKLFNCTKPTKHGPCGACDQCVAIAGGNNMDVLEMDAASNRVIDEIRILRERISLTPVAGTYKIYIIDEVHMLTTEAFNALLKTLEEPPAHAVFVLATTDPQKVPSTIQSRCVKISFGKATNDELLHALGRIAKKEKLTIEGDALTRIADVADGSFRDAVKFLEQVSFKKGIITVTDVDKLLSLATSTHVTNFVAMLWKGTIADALGEVKRLTDSGTDLRSFLTDCLTYLHERLIGTVLGGENTIAVDRLKFALNKLSGAYTEMRSSPLPQLPLELALIEFFEEKTSVIPAPAAVQEHTVPRMVIRQTIPQSEPEGALSPSLGLLTLEKLVDHWSDIISALKQYNHSVAGVLRSSRPTAAEDGIVTIEAFYKFHQEKLSEPKTKDILAQVLKKLFGEKVKVEIVLGKK